MIWKQKLEGVCRLMTTADDSEKRDITDLRAITDKVSNTCKACNGGGGTSENPCSSCGGSGFVKPRLIK